MLKKIYISKHDLPSRLKSVKHIHSVCLCFLFQMTLFVEASMEQCKLKLTEHLPSILLQSEMKV